MTEDEMVGWHHWLDGHEFGYTLGAGDRQGGLACSDSWGCKESDTAEWLNWTKLKNQLAQYISSSIELFWCHKIQTKSLDFIELHHQHTVSLQAPSLLTPTFITTFLPSLVLSVFLGWIPGSSTLLLSITKP